jgi:hypothetical protein
VPGTGMRSTARRSQAPDRTVSRCWLGARRATESRRVTEPTSSTGIRLAIALACILFVAAVAVRGIPPAKTIAPQDIVEEGPRIVDPMQFLGKGATLRAGELDTWVAADRRELFKRLRTQIFTLRNCPPLLDWLGTLDGQRLERMIVELRGGKREEALASLTLIYQLARATEWKPALMSSTRQAPAERLGAFLQDWLRTWGDRGAKDPLLSEPTVAATLLYAHVMRIAQLSPIIGQLDEPLQRARTFLNEALAAGQTKRSVLGEIVQSKHSAAMSRFLGTDDPLQGFSADAMTLFPDITGACP